MNPPTTKPTDTPLRVIRGGCWGSYDRGPSWVRAASRGSRGPANRLSGIGFRTHLTGREPRV